MDMDRGGQPLIGTVARPHNHKELEHRRLRLRRSSAEDDDRWKGSDEIGSVLLASDQEDGPQRHPLGFLLPW